MSVLKLNSFHECEWAFLSKEQVFYNNLLRIIVCSSFLFLPLMILRLQRKGKRTQQVKPLSYLDERGLAHHRRALLYVIAK